MCGRFALYSGESEIVSHFRLGHGFSMRPRYNIAPTQVIPVITKWHGHMEFFRWGFIPPWEKPIAEHIPPGYINARAETVTQRPAFKQAFSFKRCLIPGSGYYEWRKLGKQKQPYFISFKNQPLFAFAGIWSIWQDAKGEAHATCAILTQEAPEYLQVLHPRAPIVIRSEYYQEWLIPKPLLDVPAHFYQNFQDIDVLVKAVSRRMSPTSFEGPECILAL